jgi:hypothetical protein
MEWKNPFYTDATGNFPYRDCLRNAASFPSDYDSLVSLNAFFTPFNHPDIHRHGITGAKIGQVRFELICYHFI